MAQISFIPAEMDGLASTTTEAARENPFRLLMRDAGVLIKMLLYLPWIILPFRTSDSSAELYMSMPNTRDNLIQSWLFLMETVLLLLAVPATLVLPGAILIAAVALCWIVIRVICLPTQGPRILHSTMDQEAVMAAKQHEDERWIFVNGCITGHVGLQNNCNRLARTFGRPVIGIHNQSFGLIVDLMECLLQRCLSYNTMDCRVAYDYVKACLADPTVSKVVLIGHSQGGIIASMVLDKLFGDLPMDSISKLEVYTFGSAASHFNNPMRTLRPTGAAANKGVRFEVSERCVPHIEHYCNERDMITRWGVLYNTREILDNRYCGEIFVRMGASGHMFNQHYLNPMFSLDKTHACDFLDQVVDVDEKTASRRESIATQQTGIMRRESSLENFEFGDGSKMPLGVGVSGQRQSNGAVDGSGIHFVEPTSLGVTQARGKTVRQLSRLWRYTGGGSPSTLQVESLNGIIDATTPLVSGAKR
ncbi:MAG: hypothetical protein M1830_005581 [Pleopsidium flavum]|nr:MAG: hypothetical protein M1830_005581 [Pleopsidium flavum]